MTHAEAGRKGGQRSGLVRLIKGREALRACRTYRELLTVVQRLERRAYRKGWVAGRRKAEREGRAMTKEGE